MTLHTPPTSGQIGFRQGEAYIRLVPNKVESEALGLQVFDLSQFNLPGIQQLDKFRQDYQTFLQSLELEPPYFIQTRIKSHSRDKIRFLQYLGFKVTELTQHPYFDLSHKHANDSESIGNLGMEVITDTAQAQHLARMYRNSFAINRLSFDGGFNQRIISKRFESWIAGSVADPTKELIRVMKSRTNEDVALFLVRKSMEKEVFWELTALRETSQSQGIAKDVWQVLLNYHQRQQVQKISSNFSSENVKLFKIYLDLGFRLGEPSVAMHLWPI